MCTSNSDLSRQDAARSGYSARLAHPTVDRMACAPAKVAFAWNIKSSVGCSPIQHRNNCEGENGSDNAADNRQDPSSGWLPHYPKELEILRAPCRLSLLGTHPLINLQHTIVGVQRRLRSSHRLSEELRRSQATNKLLPILLELSTMHAYRIAIRVYYLNVIQLLHTTQARSTH